MDALAVAEKLQVLIVDDDPLVLDFLDKHLADGGYDVRTARDGREALGLLEGERGGIARPRIVISDWVMPQINGLDLCRTIRGRARGAGEIFSAGGAQPRAACDPFVYVIILTVHSDKSRLIEAFDAGADDFLSKPFDRGELMARVRAGERVVRLESELAARVAQAQRLNDELASVNAALTQMASTDDLTALPNRRQALSRLREGWALAERYGTPLACAMVDIDHFKFVNDRWGHSAGDQVLRTVARALLGAVRATDSVCRVGGEEFLILFPNQTAAQAAAAVDRCRCAVAATPADYQDLKLTVTVSAGVAERGPLAHSPDDLLRAADAALYAAKSSGKNRVRVADPALCKNLPAA